MKAFRSLEGVERAVLRAVRSAPLKNETAKTRE